MMKTQCLPVLLKICDERKRQPCIVAVYRSLERKMFFNSETIYNVRLNLIGAMKTFTKPNCNLCMEERLIILKIYT